MTNIILIVLDSVRRDYFSANAKKFLQLKKEFVEFTNCHSIYTDTPRSHYTIFCGDYFNKAKNQNFPAQLQKRGYVNKSFCNAGIILLYPLKGDENDTLKNIRPFRNDIIQDLGMDPAFDWDVSPLGDTFENYSGSADDVDKKIPDKWEEYIQNMSPSNNFIFLHFWGTHHNYGIDRYLPDKIPGNNYAQIGTNLIDQVKTRKISKKFVKNVYRDSISHIYFEHLEKLFGILKENGTYDNSLIIITADHGEGLGDIGFDDRYLEIYKKIYETVNKSPLLKKYIPHLSEPTSKWKMTTFFHAGDFDLQKEVPLWIKFPKSEFGGRTYKNPVSLLDIIHTINEEIDYGLDIKTDLGTSLKSLVRLGDAGRDHYLMQKRGKPVQTDEVIR
jgi:arylsulfatase A-like enzyme